MRVAREEIFGPVIVTMIPFDDEEEAIAIANDSDFGLYDYVFSEDGAAPSGGPAPAGGARRCQHRPEHHEAPFGGFKMTRHRRDRGDSGLVAYTEPQWIIWSS